MNQQESLSHIVRLMKSKRELADGGQLITLQSLEEIWTDRRLRNLATTILGAKDKEIQTIAKTIRDHFLRTVSLLVYIELEGPDLVNALSKWNYKDRDGVEGRGDRHLHLLTKQELKIRLGDCSGHKFCLERPMFSAIVIEEGRNFLEHHQRIPLIGGGEKEVLGYGRNGTVMKKIIPPGHLRCNRVTNSEDRTVAVKTIHTRSPGEKTAHETIILEVLRERLRRMTYIHTYIAIIDSVSETTILSACAAMNLEKFLGGRIQSCTLMGLIQQVKNLASALEFLHTQLDDKNTTFCHMDLKPENVLIFDSDSSNNIAGDWKITDFDISSISQAVRRKTDQGYTVTVGTRARQTPSTYQGPELQNPSAKLPIPLGSGSRRRVSISPANTAGRRTDIWSLGCIFAEVLAAQMGKLRDLRDGLKHDSRDHGNPDCYFYRKKLGRYELKPTFNALVNGKFPFNSSVHAHELGVIKRMTAIRRTQRCKAAEVKKCLEELLTQYETARRSTR